MLCCYLRRGGVHRRCVPHPFVPHPHARGAHPVHVRRLRAVGTQQQVATWILLVSRRFRGPIGELGTGGGAGGFRGERRGHTVYSHHHHMYIVYRYTKHPGPTVYSHHHHHIYTVYRYTKHPGPTVYSHDTCSLSTYEEALDRRSMLKYVLSTGGELNGFLKNIPMKTAQMGYINHCL